MSNRQIVSGWEHLTKDDLNKYVAGPGHLSNKWVIETMSVSYRVDTTLIESISFRFLFNQRISLWDGFTPRAGFKMTPKHFLAITEEGEWNEARKRGLVGGGAMTSCLLVFLICWCSLQVAFMLCHCWAWMWREALSYLLVPSTTLTEWHHYAELWFPVWKKSFAKYLSSVSRDGSCSTALQHVS